MLSKTIVQGLALSVLAGVAVAQDCPQNGAASSLFQSCGQVQGSMNVCTTGAVTSCSCSVLAHQSACYASYKENYCSAWNYQNDYFSANCGDNYADESSTSSTKSDKPASTSAEATTTAESASATDDASSSASASSRSSSAASASATASSGASASASASASRSGSSASGSAASASASGSGSAAASGTAAASASATTPGAAQQSDNAGSALGLDSLLVAGGLLAALF